jgi:hypothetical protein
MKPAAKAYSAGVKEYRHTYWEPDYRVKETDILACFKITPQAGVDREALRSLADLSGGAVIEMADFSTIPYKLTKTAVEARTSLEDEIWDTWPVLLLLVGLYCLDVGIRRLSGSS